MFRRKLANFLSIRNEFLCEAVCLVLYCPQYHLLRLLFLPQQSPEPQDHKVSEKKNEKLSGILFLLMNYYFSVLSNNFVFVSISIMTCSLEEI